jgi:hypothetical protein
LSFSVNKYFVDSSLKDVDGFKTKVDVVCENIIVLPSLSLLAAVVVFLSNFEVVSFKLKR